MFARDPYSAGPARPTVGETGLAQDGEREPEGTAMHNRIPDRGRKGEDDADNNAQARKGETIPVQGPRQEPAPRMPHERDESAGSQTADEPSGKRMGQIAHDDLERGLVDTDKGPVLEETYEKLREKDGEKKFSP